MRYIPFADGHRVNIWQTWRTMPDSLPHPYNKCAKAKQIHHIKVPTFRITIAQIHDRPKKYKKDFHFHKSTKYYTKSLTITYI